MIGNALDARAVKGQKAVIIALGSSERSKSIVRALGTANVREP